MERAPLRFRRRGVAATGSEAVAFVNPDDSAAAPSLQIYCMASYPGRER